MRTDQEYKELESSLQFGGLTADDMRWIDENVKNEIRTNTKNWVCTLTDEEQVIAKIIAGARTENNQKAGTFIPPRNARLTPEQIDLYGFGAELAFCRMFNVYPDFTTQIRSGGADCLSHKGNTIDVKWTSKQDGELLVKVSKKREEIDIFALVIGTFPTFTFVGFATVDDVFNAPITNYGHGDNYTLRQDQLKKL